MKPLRSPRGTILGAEAYDAKSRQLVLFGGVSGAGEDYWNTATWVYEGTTWKELAPPTHPPAMSGELFAYDASSEQLVLFGGEPSSGNGAYGSTWVWTGTRWTKEHPKTSPSPRYNGLLAYDAKSGQLVLFAGAGPGDGLVNGTWAWNGSNWTQLHPKTSPPAMAGQDYMAYSPGNGGLLLLGSDNANDRQKQVASTWLWTGSDWTRLHPANEPAQFNAGGAFTLDSRLSTIVLFGMQGPSGNTEKLSEIWLWTGRDWEETSTSVAPPPRSVFRQFAYDPALNESVLFGGFVGSEAKLFGDTWILTLGT